MPAQPISFTWVRQETDKVLESTDDLASFESLVRQYSRFVFKVACGVLRNAHDAEDIVQEVFLRVHRSRAKTVVDIRAWLSSVAFRLAIDRLRQPDNMPLEDLDPASPAADAEHLAIDRQRMEYARKLIAALPDDLRYPLVLSALEELSSPQIAQVLSISESSVRGRIFRARQILKEKLSALQERSHEV
jgi:RNA polymerase sigma-70 factor (ECF subfamily)